MKQAAERKLIYKASRESLLSRMRAIDKAIPDLPIAESKHPVSITGVEDHELQRQIASVGQELNRLAGKVVLGR